MCTSFEEEAIEIVRMKEECLETIQDAFERIDVLMAKIDGVLRREVEEHIVQANEVADPHGTHALSLDELDKFAEKKEDFYANTLCGFSHSYPRVGWSTDPKGTSCQGLP